MYPRGGDFGQGRGIDGFNRAERPDIERRFVDIPDYPDMYGHMDPRPAPITGEEHDERRQGPRPMGNFAPPGELPAGLGGPGIQGVDGRGGLIVTGPQRPHDMCQYPRGDHDAMVEMGLLPPPKGSRPKGFGPEGGLGLGGDDFGLGNAPFGSGGGLGPRGGPFGSGGRGFGPRGGGFV
jgi:hypothetical protein